MFQYSLVLYTLENHENQLKKVITHTDQARMGSTNRVKSFFLRPKCYRVKLQEPPAKHLELVVYDGALCRAPPVILVSVHCHEAVLSLNVLCVNDTPATTWQQVSSVPLAQRRELLPPVPRKQMGVYIRALDCQELVYSVA